MENQADKKEGEEVVKVVNSNYEGCATSECRQELTESEKDILYLLTKEFLTPQKIKIRRQCTQQAVSKIICSLKKKGAITSTYKEVVKVVSTKQPSQPNHQIRLHGQEFNIDILYKDERYKKTAEETNTIIEDGNTIRLYKESIEIYSGQFFTADTAQKATARSFEYWNRFLARLEHRLNIILVKSGSQNIKLVNHHYAEINNELAREVNIKADRIRVYANEDGKLWFNIDNSFNLHEAEAQHPETAKQDIQKVVNVFNDIRDNEHLPLSKISVVMADTTKQLQLTNQNITEISHGLKAVVDYLQSQLPDKKKEDFGVESDKSLIDYFG